MIQKARGANSRSLLREAETAILLMDENNKVWFKEAIQRMLDKRRDPELVMTGAKELRTNLLAYLEQFGEVKTANIWCRNIIYGEIKEFLSELEQELSNHDFKGVVELHLQDREINSPHIQYVGTDTLEAELVIANFILKKGYEDSLGSCLMKDHKPAYYTDEPGNLRIKSTDDEIQAQEEYKEIQAHQKEVKENLKGFIDEIVNLKNEFKNILFGDRNSERIKEYDGSNITSIRIETSRNLRREKTEDMLSEWSKRANERKARRQ